MPKKTKKEKMLASYHRKIRLLDNNQFVAPLNPSVSSPSTFKSPAIQETKKISVSPYFFPDLRKSLILTVLILGLEVSLYYMKLVK